VTTPQTDLTQAVRDALQPAVDKFFDELDKRLAVEEPTPAAGGAATMHWAGASTQHAPTHDELAAFEIDGPSRSPAPDWNIVDSLSSDWWYGHSLVVVVDGTATATNPTMGSATWTGFARDVVEAGTPVDGYARLEADLLAGLIDVHLTKLVGEDYSWTGLVTAAFDIPVNFVICDCRD